MRIRAARAQADEAHRRGEQAHTDRLDAERDERARRFQGVFMRAATDRAARTASPAKAPSHTQAPGHRYERGGVAFTSDREMKPREVRDTAREARRAQAAQRDGRLPPGQDYRSMTRNGKRVSDNLEPKRAARPGKSRDRKTR